MRVPILKGMTRAREANAGCRCSYSQAFLDERSEAMSTSVTSSPYQTPVQATSSGLSGNERTSLLPKVKQRSTFGPGNAAGLLGTTYNNKSATCL